MADDLQQTTEESKGISNRLKNAIGLGSRSTPESPLNSPSSIVAPPGVTAPTSVLLPPPVTVPPPASSPPPAASSSPVSEPPVVPVPLAAPAPAVTIDPKEAARLRAKYKRFRILVIGRANAGKTTLLKRVCNTTEEPFIFNKRRNLVSYHLIVITHSHHFFINSSNRPRRCRLSDFCTYLRPDD
jgi:hypothetical protein